MASEGITVAFLMPSRRHSTRHDVEAISAVMTEDCGLKRAPDRTHAGADTRASTKSARPSRRS